MEDCNLKRSNEEKKGKEEVKSKLAEDKYPIPQLDDKEENNEIKNYNMRYKLYNTM